MALGKAYPGGLGTVAEVLVATGRNAEVNHLWAALSYLSSLLLPEVAPDAVAWASLARPQGYRRLPPAAVVSARRKAAGLHASSRGLAARRLRRVVL
jgi:hypothetical protein